MKPFHLPLFAAFALAACQSAETPPEAEPLPAQPIEEQKACGADELQYLLGSPVGGFDFDALGRSVRILPPGSLYTQDYVPQRLNVDVDGGGTILRLWCG